MLNKILTVLLSNIVMISSFIPSINNSRTILPNPEIISFVDDSTVDTYKDAIKNESSSKENGRIWVDKSVYKHDDTNEANTVVLDDKFNISYDDDFLEVFSALGSSQKTSYEQKTGIDISISLDVSASMNINDRIGQAVESLNNFIDTAMTESENNRISISAFGKEAEVCMPLDHYSKKDNQDYISLSYSNVKPGHSTANYFQLKFTAVKKDGTEVNKIINNIDQGYANLDPSGINVGPGTNIQKGNFKALEVLTKSELDDEINQIPVFILFTDGYANACNEYIAEEQYSWYKDTDKVNHYLDNGELLGLLEDAQTINPMSSDVYKKTTNEEDEGIGCSNIIIMQTLMSTAYKKAEVEKHYKDVGKNSSSLLAYNVGVDLAEYYESYRL